MIKSRTIWAGLFFILSVSLALPNTGWSETVEIHFSEKYFEPAFVHLKKGDTVRFVNTDNLLHTATGGKAPESSQEFDSGYMTKKMIYEFTPQRTGVIDFFCVMHSDVMRGALIVETPGLKPAAGTARSK